MRGKINKMDSVEDLEKKMKEVYTEQHPQLHYSKKKNLLDLDNQIHEPEITPIFEPMEQEEEDVFEEDDKNCLLYKKYCCLMSLELWILYKKDILN